MHTLALVNSSFLFHRHPHHFGNVLQLISPEFSRFTEARSKLDVFQIGGTPCT